MQIAVPQLTTIVLLVHMVLGCCWHHGHACEVDGGGMAVQGEGCGLHKEGMHSDKHGGCNSSHGAPGERDEACEGGRCTFLRSKSSFEDDASTAGALPALDAWAAASHVPVPFDLEKTSRGADFFPGKPLLPTRAHLLFRVLLI